MCALCSVLGGAERWTDAAARSGVFTRNSDPIQRRRERNNRVAGASRVLSFYGLTLSDWQSASFPLSTEKGKTELIDNLSHLWAAAEKFLGRSCDPLDPVFPCGWRWAVIDAPVFTPANPITGILGSGKTTLLQRLLAGLTDAPP